MKDVNAVAVTKKGRRLVRRSGQQWRALIEAQARSGMSIAAFCRDHGVCVGSMDNWRKRLRDERALPGAVEQLTLPGFDVHRIAGNVLMNGGHDGQERSSSEPAVHGRVQA